MDAGLLHWIVCPLCGADLDAELECVRGHTFPIVDGVPRLVPSVQSKAEASIRDSFSREWGAFDYDADRTWGANVDERVADFLRHTRLEPAQLKGKLVADAGCGNGVLSHRLAELFGCDVVATDISESVVAARHYFADEARVHYVQSDLMHLALRPATFDVVYCAGVLHHTPDPCRTFINVASAVKPGGVCFVWLYWDEAGAKARAAELLRRALMPLPDRAQHAIVWSLVPQSIARQRLRLRLHGEGSERRMTSREQFVRMLDSFTPRHRSRHTPYQLADWYATTGFADVETTEAGRSGFGLVARRPASPVARVAAPFRAETRRSLSRHG